MDHVPLCEPWPATLPCDLTGASPAVTGAAHRAASEYYWARSGHRFGVCEVTIRPCKATCPGAGAWPYWSGDAWPGWMGPAHGAWRVGWACGQCHGDCSCGIVDRIRLPAHAESIVAVVVDGVALDASAYRLMDDGTELLRVDGNLWPSCQDWSVPVSGTGAWSVTATFGWPVPTLGSLAVGELVCEFVKAVEPAVGECKLPGNVRQLVRANTTFTFASSIEFLNADMAGLPLGDRFLDAYNPHARSGSGEAMGRLRLPARIWNPDDL